MSNVRFELTEGCEIKYANGTGNEIECNFIELREPTGKVSHICCEIESLIQSGIMKMAGILDEETIAQAKEAAKEDKSEEVGPDAESVLAMMTGSGIDMQKVVIHFRELFKQVAFMGGEKAITVPRMDDMNHKDFRKMMGEYASTFILS